MLLVGLPLAKAEHSRKEKRDEGDPHGLMRFSVPWSSMIV
jgi:hypothetical protein